MVLTRASADDYLQVLQQLLPVGAAWPRDPYATLTKVLAAQAAELARNHNRTMDLLDEADPRTTSELLPDWERVAGLPDDCTPEDAAIQERRNALVQKLTGRGGQSRDYFIAVAAALGFTVTITEFRPMTCEDDCESPICDEAWWFAWQVNAPETTVFEAGCDETCEVALRWWGNDILECVISRLKPAHTHVQFAYGG